MKEITSEDKIEIKETEKREDGSHLDIFVNGEYLCRGLFFPNSNNPWHTMEIGDFSDRRKVITFSDSPTARIDAINYFIRAMRLEETYLDGHIIDTEKLEFCLTCGSKRVYYETDWGTEMRYKCGHEIYFTQNHGKTTKACQYKEEEE